MLIKNIKILREISADNDIPQDLVINGMRLNLTVRTIAGLKVAFWSITYLLLIAIAYEIIIGQPEREHQEELLAKEHQTTLIPFNQFIKNIGRVSKPKQYVSLYKRGKILPINGDENKTDDFFFQLPSTMRPKDTSEIGTIIKIFRKQETVGKYTDNTTAYHKFMKVQFFDLVTHEFIGEETVYGVLPPESKKHSGDDEGGDPNISLMDLLRKLPIK